MASPPDPQLNDLTLAAAASAVFAHEQADATAQHVTLPASPLGEPGGHAACRAALLRPAFADAFAALAAETMPWLWHARLPGSRRATFYAAEPAHLIAIGWMGSRSRKIPAWARYGCAAPIHLIRPCHPDVTRVEAARSWTPLLLTLDPNPSARRDVATLIDLTDGKRTRRATASAADVESYRSTRAPSWLRRAAGSPNPGAQPYTPEVHVAAAEPDPLTQIRLAGA